MFRLIAFAFLTCFQTLLLAQDYQALVVEGATWVTWREQEYIDKYHAFEIAEDTLVGDTLYKKVLFHQLRDGQRDPYVLEETMLGGLIREDLDNRKVYGRLLFEYILLSDPCREFYYQDQEFVLYDFEIEVGDSITTCGYDVFETVLVNGIDSMEIYGQKRRIFQNKYDEICEIYLIDGIGNMDGLFATYNPFISPGDQGSELQVYCTGGSFNCNIVSSSSDIGLEAINVFPNPAQEWIDVSASQNIDNFSILGMDGKKFIFGAYQERIDITSLSSGSYILVLESKSERIHFHKFVKYFKRSKLL